MNQIVAVDKNWAIGKDGDLLVSIPADMKFFRETTKGHTVIMGRKTLESFPGGRPLKNRVNIVLSRRMEPGETVIDEKTRLVVLSGPEELTAWFEKRKAEEPDAEGMDDAFVIGGGSVYRMLLPLCGRALVTFVRHGFEGPDTFYPNLDEDPDWVLAEESEVFEWTPPAPEDPAAGEDGDIAPAEPLRYSFRTYERKEHTCC